MKKLLYLLILSLGLFGMYSCDEGTIKSLDKDKPEEPEFKTTAIDSDILIGIRENLETKTISLYCQTEKDDYSCCNIPITTQLSLNEKPLKIEFTGVADHLSGLFICATALGPATTEVNLSTLENGEYKIELNCGIADNKGVLTVTDTTIELRMNSQKGIKVTTPVLQRVPADTYWGWIGYGASSSIDKANEFLGKLGEMGASFNKQTPGYYLHYEIDQDGNMKTPDNMGYWSSKPFIFQYAGDKETFRNDIRSLSKLYYDELHISIYDDRGDFIYNWGN